MRMVSRDRTPEELQPIGIQAPAILYLAALILWACSAKTEIPAPWGESRHETGPILDPDALRGALEWGRVNAQAAEKALDAYYTFGLQHEQFFHRARVRTRWTPVGASRSRAKARFPGAGSGSSGGHPQGPPLGDHDDQARLSQRSGPPLGYVSGPRGAEDLRPLSSAGRTQSGETGGPYRGLRGRDGRGVFVGRHQPSKVCILGSPSRTG